MSSDLDRGWGCEFQRQPRPEEYREEPEADGVDVPEALPRDEEGAPRWDADADSGEDPGTPFKPGAGGGHTEAPPTDLKPDGDEPSGVGLRRGRLGWSGLPVPPPKGSVDALGGGPGDVSEDLPCGPG